MVKKRINKAVKAQIASSMYRIGNRTPYSMFGFENVSRIDDTYEQTNQLYAKWNAIDGGTPLPAEERVKKLAILIVEESIRNNRRNKINIAKSIGIGAIVAFIGSSAGVPLGDHRELLNEATGFTVGFIGNKVVTLEYSRKPRIVDEFVEDYIDTLSMLSMANEKSDLTVELLSQQIVESYSNIPEQQFPPIPWKE